MLEKGLFFERLPDPDFSKELYSVSSFNDDALNHGARYLRAGRHSTTQQAVSNLITGIDGSKRILGINGHGSPGLVETGAGPRGSENENQYLSRGNQSLWGDEFDRLFDKNFDEFRIYSCSTGAGRGGAYLLWLIAKHSDKKVTARTGLLYAVRNGNRYWFETEKGATWQMANADMIEPPEPIQTPSNFLDYKNLKKSFEYFEDNSLVNISFDDIIKIEIISANKEKLIISKESYFFFLESIFYTEAISINGEISGMIQMDIVIYSNEKKYLLSIFEDRFCKFVGQPIGYFISQDFRNYLQQ